ncbi:hypothetical protein J2Y74_001736 [Pseudomonas migulae]|nr:hypothetical protein [Pseudomonas migulae]
MPLMDCSAGALQSIVVACGAHQDEIRFVYSQLTCIMFCYIRYTISNFSPTRPKVAPLI